MEREREGGTVPVLRAGAAAGTLALFVALVGMVSSFEGRQVVEGLLSLGRLLWWLFPFVGGYTAAAGARGWPAAALRAALAGAVAAVPSALLVLVGRTVDLRSVFVNASPALYRLLTGDRPGLAGPVALGLGFALVGVAGGLLRAQPEAWRRPLLHGLTAVCVAGIFRDLVAVVLTNLGVPAGVIGWLYGPRGLTPAGVAAILAGVGAISAWAPALQRAAARRAERLPGASRRALRPLAGAALVLALLALPGVVGPFTTYALVMVGLYALMGLGLNIVVGWAGLLDLGFVAFFAIGAYTVALLTSPEVQYLARLSFWEALPVAVLAAVAAGVLLGVPVLGMRGDYLAIATLGFGEIVRILVGSDFLRPWTGGSQGITRVPPPSLGGLSLQGPEAFYYLLLACTGLSLWVAARLRRSRLGRAWLAIREDEDVAQALGIDLVRTKLAAFCLGAAFAGTSGALFAGLVGSVYPHSFHLLVSINVLALVIVGGMGSIPGVIAGALALVGLPELLREFAEFRLLVYGALLILVMLRRPEGLWPERPAVAALAAPGQEAPVPAGARAGVARGATP